MLTLLVAVLIATGVGLVSVSVDGGRQRRDPVLLVHGFDGSSRSWRVMQARLRDAGYRDDELRAISYDSRGSNVDIADQIRVAVDDLLERTDARRVDVVSHSMGAISSRYYVERLDGADRVDAWVSLGGVNSGTIWAYGCAFLTSCREMVPGSPVLAKLAREFRPDAGVRYATWWSPCDPTIIPPGAATIAGARNTETACIGHSALKTDPTVFGQVLRFVAARHRSG